MNLIDPRLRQELCDNVTSGLNASWDRPRTPINPVPRSSAYLKQASNAGWQQISVTNDGMPEPVRLLRAVAIGSVANAANNAAASAAQNNEGSK